MDVRLKSLFSGGQRFVELGCGSGDGPDALAHLYADTVGIDISRARLELRSKPPVGWRFVLSNLDDVFPLEDQSVDALLANQVIEHISDPVAFAKEALRVLKPDGIFVVTTPNIRYAKHVWRLVFRGLGPETANSNTLDGVWDDGHIHYFTHRDLRKVFLDTGFSSVRSQGLIDTRSGGLIRRLLDTFSAVAPIREFLSGNMLVVAKK